MRDFKGNSILSFPSDYVAIDLETTGFSPEFDEIIEIACVRYQNGQEVDSFSHLVKPRNMELVDDFVVSLTGITLDMLQNAEGIETVLPAALQFLGNSILVGHNVSFDVNFLYDNAERIGMRPLTNDYIDTRRLARRLFPEMQNYKLKTLIKKCKLPEDTAHRAYSDARQTAKCLQYMSEYAITNNLQVSIVSDKHRRSVRSSDICANPNLIKEDSPFFDKTVVFTGALEQMTRETAMQLIADLGGHNGDTVTKKTDYLVISNKKMSESALVKKSSKHKKAERYILAGADLKIISENVFYDLISDTVSEEVQPEQAESIHFPTVIPCNGIELTDFESEFINYIASILKEHPNFSILFVDRRSDNYLSIVVGNNDFLRFKYSLRAKWISLRLPREVAKKNMDNPIFAAQRNKAQYHWKANIASLDDLNGLAEFINCSCIEYE